MTGKDTTDAPGPACLERQIDDLKIVRDYWHSRCMAAEDRVAELEAEVQRLRERVERVG